MDNKETYGIELQLLVDKFNKKLKQIKSDINSLGNKTKDSLTPEVEIKPNVNLENLNKGIAALNVKISNMFSRMYSPEDNFGTNREDLNLLERYVTTYNQLLKARNKLSYKPISSDKKIIVEDTENIKDKYYWLKKLNEARKEEGLLPISFKEDEQNNLPNYEEESRNATSNLNKIGSNIDKLTKKMGRYLLSIFSIRSAYAAVSRASSAYLSIDTELANKTQAAWIGLGAIISPVIEKLSDALLKLVGYINVFVNALTGVDYIAKATSKYLDNVSNSSKKAANSLATFDTIVNLNNASDTSSNPFSAFDDIKLNDNIVKKLQDLAYWLKENWSWIKQVGEILLIAFAGTKFLEIIGNISNLNSNLGANGLLGALKDIATFGSIAITIYVAGNVIKDLKEIKTTANEIRTASGEVREEWLKNDATIDDVYKTMTVNNNAALDSLGKTGGILATITGLSKTWLDNAEQVVKNSSLNLDYLKEQYNQGLMNENQQDKLLSKLVEQVNANKKIIDMLEINNYDTGELVKINEQYKDFTWDIYQNLLKQGYSYDEIYKKTGLTKDEIYDIKGICDSDFTLKLDVDTSSASKKTSNFFAELGESFSSLFTISGFKELASNVLNVTKSGIAGWISKIKNIWKFDEGTNYVPNDNLAIVHKGEAVVPKKFNSQTFFAQGSEETNYLLRELISTLERKDMNAYIDSNAIGKTATNYINKQRRIMGRDIV